MTDEIYPFCFRKSRVLNVASRDINLHGYWCKFTVIHRNSINRKILLLMSKTSGKCAIQVYLYHNLRVQL